MELIDDAGLTTLHGEQIDGDAVDGQPQFPGVFQVFEELGGVQHGLCRDAPDVQAGAADLLPL